MEPLATGADLTVRGIMDGDQATLDTLLAAASAEVRNAAGAPISRATWTADLPGTPREWLTLPGQPIISVTDVLLDGEPVTGWRLVGGRIWRRGGWRRGCEPSVVTVTVTGGLQPVPEDIVDLVCSMVGSALPRVTEGYSSRQDDPTSMRIDDYSETRTVAAEERLAGPMELPERTRRRLAARFGGGAAVVGAGR